MVCEVAGIGGEGEEAGGERVRLRGEGIKGILEISKRVGVEFEAKQMPRFTRDNAVFRRVVASG